MDPHEDRGRPCGRCRSCAIDGRRLAVIEGIESSWCRGPDFLNGVPTSYEAAERALARHAEPTPAAAPWPPQPPADNDPSRPELPESRPELPERRPEPSRDDGWRRGETTSAQARHKPAQPSQLDRDEAVFRRLTGDS